MREFDIKNSGTCFAALVEANWEAKALGLEPRSQAWYEFIEKRKYEIADLIEAKAYKFTR